MNKLFSISICIPAILLAWISPAWAQVDSSTPTYLPDFSQYTYISESDMEAMTNCIGDYDDDGDVDANDFEAYRRGQLIGGGTTSGDFIIIPDPDLVDDTPDPDTDDDHRFRMARETSLNCLLVQVAQSGIPFAPIPVIGGSLGGAIGLGNPGFGATQFIIPSPGITGRLYAELLWPHKFGARTHLALGVAGIYGSTFPGFVGNVGSPATVATGGRDSHVGGIIYAALERSVAPRVNVRLLAGAGIAWRNLNLTAGGITAAQGGGVVPVIQVGGQVFRRVNENVDIGLGVYVTRVGGINTNVGGTTVRLGPAWDAKAMVEMRVVLDRLRRLAQPKQLVPSEY